MFNDRENLNEYHRNYYQKHKKKILKRNKLAKKNIIKQEKDPEGLQIYYKIMEWI